MLSHAFPRPPRNECGPRSILELDTFPLLLGGIGSAYVAYETALLMHLLSTGEIQSQGQDEGRHHC